MKAKFKKYKKAVAAFLTTFIAGSPLAFLISDFNLETFLGLVVTGILTAAAVALTTNEDPTPPEAEPMIPFTPPVTG